MAQDSAIPPESFEEILAWLDPDREIAAKKYVQFRNDLTRVFIYRGCQDPEELTDQVFDRVAKKIRALRPVYEGDPEPYFRAVANNVLKEEFKKAKLRVSLEGVDLPPQTTIQPDDDRADIQDCLDACLQTISVEHRKLITGYYAKEKQAKIDHRSELAQQLGISVETLRVKVYRIRKFLQQCIEHCIERKAQGE